MPQTPLSSRLGRDDRGQDLIEYAVIAAFVCLVALVGATTLGNTISAIYHSTTHSVDHGATFTSSGSSSTGGAGGCNKDSKDGSASTPTTPPTTSTSTGSSTCK